MLVQTVTGRGFFSLRFVGGQWNTSHGGRSVQRSQKDHLRKDSTLHCLLNPLLFCSVATRASCSLFLRVALHSKVGSCGHVSDENGEYGTNQPEATDTHQDQSVESVAGGGSEVQQSGSHAVDVTRTSWGRRLTE